MTPEAIRTDRLELRLITLAEAADMAAARTGGARPDWWHPEFPREDDVDGASMIGPGGDPWGSRLILLEGVAVGSIGFFGPPQDVGGVAEVEIGYGLVEGVRRRGIATEALRAMLAHADADAVRVRASVEPGNIVSMRMLAGRGFTDLRGSDDEGNLVMARPLLMTGRP